MVLAAIQHVELGVADATLGGCRVGRPVGRVVRASSSKPPKLRRGQVPAENIGSRRLLISTELDLAAHHVLVFVLESAVAEHYSLRR